MEKIKTIIIEDEPLARDHLKDLASRNVALDIIGVYESPQELQRSAICESISLILSDIQMPHMDGVTFLKSLENPPFFIFVTAHPEFALEGFDLDVIDYILKPTLTVERLSKAIERVKTAIKYQRSDFRQDILKFKDGPTTVFLYPTDILFIQSWGDYIKITTHEETVVVKSTLKALEDILPGDSFVRIHRSHMVHIAQIRAVDAVSVRLKTGQKFDIGLQYRDFLYSKIGMPLR
ncbi:LytR/AlgR family response regulator transcription factor [Sphingobacterium deserti]|uniref:LytTR family two component transcriptional regulator n=1 Tax=Sphingobacterium deserti TaxID=1229276 RepID=A0A0B8T8Z0_9SPHI|nr:LytTR family DNA-binding domain-containing protein [Sphingobacterium deserti]KGE14440.1 LytTR family two component transcriptional regulator [Sphingobacterium deserti]